MVLVRAWISVVFLTMSLLAAMAVPSLSGPKATFDNPADPEMTPRLRLGKMNYDAYCASCHGKRARGTDKGPTFISRIYHPGHHGDPAFFIASKRGARAHHFQFGDMRPVKGVNDAHLKTIIQYVRAVQRANGLF